MNAKKAVAILLTASMTMMLAIGCSGGKEKTSESNKESEGGVTLTLYGDADETTKPYMTKIFELYEEKTGNKIDVQGLETSNFDNICLTKFQTGDIPDILMHHGAFSLDAYNPAENFVDFSDAEWVSDISEGSLSQSKRDGIVYGLPFWESSVTGCFYNKEIFKEQNLEVPTTQAEFDDVCQKLVDAGIQPLYLAAADAWPILHDMGMNPVMAEGDTQEKLNTNQLTYAEIPEMTSLLEWFKMAADKGYFGDTFATDTWNYAAEVLGNGEAAMMICWDTWFDTDYDNEAYEYTSDDFGIMPIFMGTKDDGTYGGPNNCLLLANKNSERVETAIDFINFCADPENYNIAFEGIATTPTLKGMTTNKLSVQYQESAESIEKLICGKLDVVGFSGVDEGKCIQNLLIGNTNVEECLAEMDAGRIKAAEALGAEGF